MSFRERICTFLGDGPTVANNATRQTLFPNGLRPSLPFVLWIDPDKDIEIFMAGRISTLAAGGGTITFDALFEGAQVWSSGAIPLNATAKTNVGWWLHLMLSARALGTGTNAKLIGSGSFKSEALVGSPAVTAGGVGEAMLPFNTPPGVQGAGWDSELTQRLEIASTFSVANAAYSITPHQGWVEICSS